MTVNTVLVTVTAGVGPADIAKAEGNVVAVPSGTMWPASGDPTVPAVVQATLGDLLNGGTAGEAIIELVASDNFAAGVLSWDFVINIRGLPTISVSDVPVNFASGANQDIWAILKAAGWAPPAMP